MNIVENRILDIERWVPSHWNQIIGNQNLKEFMWDMIWCVRKEGHRSGFNTLLTGNSRGGKTSGVTLGIKALGCANLDFETFNPCGYCYNCKAKTAQYGNGGWENWVDIFGDEEEAKKSVRFLYIPLDCTRLNERDIDEVIAKVRLDDGNLKIIYLDEVHRLVRRGLDEQLLRPLENCEAIWIASSAYVKKEDREEGIGEGRKQNSLEVMFQNRFTYRLETQKPPVDEMIVWLAERCAEWGIRVEAPDSTLQRLAERSRCLPGMALQVINKAHKKRSKLLTREMVDEHVFNFDD